MLQGVQCRLQEKLLGWGWFATLLLNMIMMALKLLLAGVFVAMQSMYAVPSMLLYKFTPLTGYKVLLFAFKGKGALPYALCSMLLAVGGGAWYAVFRLGCLAWPYSGAYGVAAVAPVLKLLWSCAGGFIIDPVSVALRWLVWEPSLVVRVYIYAV